jgi:transcriptional regulator with XRE-family HTH domain
MSTSPFSRRFGLVVRRERLKAKLSQEKLAELAELHPTYIGMVERGVRNPSIDVAARIAAALATPLSRLIESAELTRTKSERRK